MKKQSLGQQNFATGCFRFRSSAKGMVSQKCGRLLIEGAPCLLSDTPLDRHRDPFSLVGDQYHPVARVKVVGMLEAKTFGGNVQDQRGGFRAILSDQSGRAIKANTGSLTHCRNLRSKQAHERGPLDHVQQGAPAASLQAQTRCRERNSFAAPGWRRNGDRPCEIKFYPEKPCRTPQFVAKHRWRGDFHGPHVGGGLWDIAANEKFS